MNQDDVSEIKYFTSEAMKSFPLSEAVRVGNTLYLSGQIGIDASVKLVSGGITAETRQVMENIKAILTRYGSSFDQVIKMTVMLTDMAEWAEMNKVYVGYFPTNFPARSAFGVSGLALGARVEIACTAIVPEKKMGVHV